MKTIILSDLAAANGRRKVRTITPEDIYTVLRRASQHGVAAAHGGTVQARYGYRAWTTAAYAARRSDGGVRLWIAERRATYGATLTPLSALRAMDPQSAQQWADQDPVPGDSSLILTAQEVAALLGMAEERRETTGVGRER